MQGTPLPKEAGTFDAEITTGGMTRQFRVHVPVNYRENVSLPLALVFHGATDTAEQVERQTAMSDQADWEGFFVVYPQGLNNAWYISPGAGGEQDRQFIRDLVSYLENQYSIDPKRIYATGISNGGGMADRLACSMADMFAAIAPVAGGYSSGKDCRPARPVPVISFHGLGDNIIPYSDGNSPGSVSAIETWAANWAERNGCTPTPEITKPKASVTVRTWSSCQQGADVVLYTIEGHGHSWPGSPTMPKEITSQAVDANGVMWEFFKAHPMP